jgi:hypothetical protein
MSGFISGRFPTGRESVVAVAVVFANLAVASCGARPTSATPPISRDIRSLSIIPASASACPGHVIASEYVARLADGSRVSLGQPELSLLAREGTAAEPQDDGAWRATTNPLASAVTGFRLSATLRADSSVHADTVVAPTYGCASSSISLAAIDSRDGPTAYVRLGTFRTPFADSIVVAVVEAPGRGPSVFVLGPKEMRSGAIKVDASGRVGAAGRAGSRGSDGGQCEDGGPGEDADDGGPGTSGGEVNVIVQSDAPWLADLVAVTNFGGRGGPPGRGGLGGRGGPTARVSGGTVCSTKPGRNGRDSRPGPDGIAGPRPRTTTVLPALLWPGSPIWFDATMKPALEQLIDYTASHTKG